MPKVELQASLFNLPPAVELFGNAQEIDGFLEAAEYDGIQYSPVRTPHLGRFERLVEAGDVMSFQQSWAHGLPHLAYRLALSGVASSTHRIERLRQHLPDALRSTTPTIVHPNEQYLGGRRPTWNIDYPALRSSGVLGPLLHQPTVEVLDAWRLLGMSAHQAAEDLVDLQGVHGFDGIALDLHHLTARRAGMQLGRGWVNRFVAELASIGALGGSSEVQASLRPDFGGKASDAEQIMNGNLLETRAGELLGIIKGHLAKDQQKLRVTVEARPKAFVEVGGYLVGNKVVCAAIRGLFSVS